MLMILQIFHESNDEYGVNELSLSRSGVHLLFLDVIRRLTSNPAQFPGFGVAPPLKLWLNASIGMTNLRQATGNEPKYGDNLNTKTSMISFVKRKTLNAGTYLFTCRPFS
jgi:hypothetical protein